VTGRRELALVTEADEIAMGRAGAASIAATVGLHPDAALQTYVRGIGLAVAARSERPQLAWEFNVVDDASINAFALPGGYIFVTRGLLTHMMNEAELASVLGHESGHVAARHSVQQMSRQQLMSLGLGLGSALSPTIAQFGQVASAGLELLFLKYGRDDETQADALGFRYALASGYDTRVMSDVFVMLDGDAALSGGGRLPQWQSTHPDPGDRIAHVQKMVAASTTPFAGTRVGETDFLGRLDGMAYGADPRQGYFASGLFLHPALKFTMRFPAGWGTQNASDAVRAVPSAGDALVELRAAQGSASDAAQRFASQEGVQANAPTARSINGNRAVSTEFGAATSDGGRIAGLATFIEYGGATWAIVGYSLADRFATYRAMMQATAESFTRLTDASVLAAQPQRISIEKATRAMTLAEFQRLRPSTISLEELAVINGMESSGHVTAGQSMKRVLGTPVPRAGQ
jgi:predicted Zn-dependent protease